MSYTVVFSPEASADLLDIYNYIAKESSPQIAKRFTDAIVNHCDTASLSRHSSDLGMPTLKLRQDIVRSGPSPTSATAAPSVSIGIPICQRSGYMWDEPEIVPSQIVDMTSRSWSRTSTQWGKSAASILRRCAWLKSS